jgi:hypothetical protein
MNQSDFESFIKTVNIPDYTKQLFDIFLRAHAIENQIITINNIFVNRPT